MTAYRVIAFTNRTTTTGKGKRQKTHTQGCAYVVWSHRQNLSEGRLEGSGSFCHTGLHAVVEARKHLALPDVHQVVINTNQDRAVYCYFKQADGRITAYAADDC